MRETIHKSILEKVPEKTDRDFFRKIRSSIARFIRPKPTTLLKKEGWKTIRVSIAGVMHENRFQAVSQLSLLELVILKREPKNEYDPNAIEILRQDGKRLGYVGKTIAKNLAPFMDEIKHSINALVTDITSDISGTAIGASVCFYLPADIYSTICCEEKKEIDYYFESASDGTVYLMINCDEAILNQLNDKFMENKLEWVRSGLSYRSALNGLQYRWYVRFIEGITQEAVDKFIKQEFSIIPFHEKASKELDEFMSSFDSENKDLKIQRSNLQEVIQKINEENNLLRSNISDLERCKSNKWNNEIIQIFQELLPNVELMRDSVDVITHEVKNYQQVLRLLHTISTYPEQLKGVKVESAKGWFERHFSTGEKDDGRIYYKQEGSKWLVLISFKNSQSHDIQWLHKK